MKGDQAQCKTCGKGFTITTDGAYKCSACRYKARPKVVKTCPCGRQHRDASHANCRECQAGGREAYLARKAEDWRRKCEREGREYIPRGRASDLAEKAEARQRTALLSRLLRDLQRKLKRDQLEALAGREGVSVAAIKWRERYNSDPLWREQQRLRARDKKFRNAQQREAASDGSLTPAALVALFAAAKCCPFCKKRMRSQDKSLDHITPLSKGGAHSILNALVCCKRCNAKKHARHIRQMLPVGAQLPMEFAA